MWCECRCGMPVVLVEGKEENILRSAGVNSADLDETCIIVLSHCPSCTDMSKKGPADAVIVKGEKNDFQG